MKNSCSLSMMVVWILTIFVLGMATTFFPTGIRLYFLAYIGGVFTSALVCSFLNDKQ